VRRSVAACLFACLHASFPTNAASPEFALPPVISTVVVPSDEPISNAEHPLGATSSHFLTSSRYYGAGDFRGTGLNDIVYTATYFEWQPNLPLQIWANLGNGKFEDRTAAVIEGEIPRTGTVNNIFVHDFNNDGRDDIFVVDQGLEDKVPGFYDGAQNILLLSGPNGKLYNRSGELPQNEFMFNHVSSMADVNGDGHQDIVLTRLGGVIRSGGVLFLFGDGQGRFTASSAGLPHGLAFPIAANNDPLRQTPGSATVCDLDGDGRGDLITGSYGVDGDGGRWVRVHQQQADGSFIEKVKLPMAAEVALVSYRPTEPTRKLGAHQFLCSKLTGSARNDFVISWEGSRISYVQVMRNDGNFQFADITIAALGTYKTGYDSLNGTHFQTAKTEIMDFDEDGDDDIVFFALGSDARTYAGGGSFVHLNDGAGHFTPFTLSSGGQPLTQADVVSKVFGGCSSCSFISLIFDAGGSTKKDIVLLRGFNPTVGPRFRNQSMSIRTLFNGEPNPAVVPTLPAPSVFSTAQSSSQSFLRFFNTGTTAGSVTVSVNHGTSGELLGLWDSGSLPADSERQFAISTIETVLGISANKPSYYALSMHSEISGYFQHVLFRPADGTLTNLSTCAAGVTADPAKLSGVHSSTVGDLGYPSIIAVSNTGSAAAPVSLGIYDAFTGTKLGTYPTASIPANGQAVLTIGAIEAGALITPSPSIGHYVIKAEGSFNGFLQHLVNNQKAGVTTDMTTACALNGTSSTAGSSPLRTGAIFSTAQTISQSFLRLYNTGQSGGTVTATMRDYVSGQSLGQWTSPNIPPGAELQYPISTVESDLTLGAGKPSYYTMSLTSGFGGYFQHVLFRPADGTLTNLSTCAAGVTADPDKLSGVHSTLFTAFPSSVVARNISSASLPLFLVLADARTGSILGQYTSPTLVPPYGQLVIPVSAIEAGIGLVPTAGMFHYVISRVGPFSGFLQHLVANNQVGVVTDMTTACVLSTN